MLLCPTHRRLIDGYPPDYTRANLKVYTVPGTGRDVVPYVTIDAFLMLCRPRRGQQ